MAAAQMPAPAPPQRSASSPPPLPAPPSTPGSAHVAGATLSWERRAAQRSTAAAAAAALLLWVHGLGHSCRYWDTTLGSFPEHSHLTVDLRSHGKSQAKEYGGLSLSRWAADLAAVLDACHVTVPVVLIGHSLGGVVALEFALTYPTRVAGLVLLATSSRVSPAGTAAWTARADAMQARGDASSAAAIRALSSYNFDGRLTEVDVPVLVVHGDADPLVPWRAAPAMAQRLPRANLAIVPGADHDVLRSTVARDVLVWWLQRIGGAAAGDAGAGDKGLRRVNSSAAGAGLLCRRARL